MKTIGLIGGMSWESSSEYYRIINQQVSARLGGLHSADCLMYSFDFAEIEELMREGKWDVITRKVIEAAQRLESDGADCIVICTNTIHKLAVQVQGNVSIPLIHIADAAGERVKSAGLKVVGLLGTRFTMEGDFYTARLLNQHQIEAIIPGKADREIIDRVIFEELVRGVIKADSKAEYIRIISGLIEQGAEGIILGCTEIPLLIQQEDVPVPVFDTTRIHAEAAVDFALKRPARSNSG